MANFQPNKYEAGRHPAGGIETVSDYNVKNMNDSLSHTHTHTHLQIQRKIYREKNNHSTL